MYVANGKEMNDMMTVTEKNARARELVESLESPAMTRDLLNALEGDPDLRMKSMVCYHLMRRILDDGSFRPEQTLEMENVQRPFCASCWRLPYAHMFPVYSSGTCSFAGYHDRSSDGFVINLCAFAEEKPVIGFRYACKETSGQTVLFKGLVPYHDGVLHSRYPDWEFYKADRDATDDMTAFLARDFGHVFLAEMAHLDPEDGRLHRIFMSNE